MDKPRLAVGIKEACAALFRILHQAALMILLVLYTTEVTVEDRVFLTNGISEMGHSKTRLIRCSHNSHMIWNGSDFPFVTAGYNICFSLTGAWSLKNYMFTEKCQ